MSTLLKEKGGGLSVKREALGVDFTKKEEVDDNDDEDGEKLISRKFKRKQRWT